MPSNLFTTAGALALALSLSAIAQPMPREQLPEPLAPWADWVLHGSEATRCPFLQGDAAARECAWPAKLSLVLDDDGGRFEQRWRVDAAGWMPLPGDTSRWPQDVRVNGAAAVVAPREGVPAVLLSRGEHTVTGTFLWDAMPESLAIPVKTGLLALTVRGKEVPLPNRDGGGRVFLQKDPSQSTEAERIEIRVHRRVVDDIPLQLVTRLELAVSGKSREVLLGRALPDGFIPMALTASLPSRVEPDGRLRVQVRRGSWNLELVARHDGPVTGLTRPMPGGQWTDGEEYWVFEARNDLRQVRLEGVPAMDPQQTTLPDEWRRLPAYAMKVGDTLTFAEKRRGDADPPPDALELSRQLWLDFEGTGYSIQDRVTGAIHRSWRLEMNEPTVLGRVAASGSEQFITRVSPDAPSGVEIRQGRVNLLADSRLQGSIRRVPAVSWNTDFQNVRATLNLPPGWRALHISGADQVSRTWVENWSLLDLFLVMIIAAAVGRLFGAGWGALAFVAVALTLPEDGPRWVWLPVLAIEPLVRLLPQGRLRALLRFGRLLAWAALVLVAFDFTVDHVRAGLYPALERPSYQMGGVQTAEEYNLRNQQEVASSISVGSGLFANEAPAAPEEESEEYDSGGYGPQVQQAMPMKKTLKDFARRERAYSVQEYDKNATVQTGPGLPRWDWNSVELTWSGPVERTQMLELMLLSPAWNTVLAFVRAVLLALLVLCVLGLRGDQLRAWWRRFGRGASQGAAVLLAVVLGVSPVTARASDIPSPELLEELRRRLVQQPDCLPTCASSPRMVLEANARTLRARMEVSAAASTAIPLPGSAQHWVPQTVLLDGRPAPALLRTSDGTLWLALSPGNHQVILEGALPARETVQLALPLRPYRVEARVDGWTVDGLHEDGVADNDLQLTRGASTTTDEALSSQQSALPPFVHVERELLLGLGWEVQTKVARVTPLGSAVVLEVPLLPGESVTSDEVRVQGGKALVNMGPQVSEVSWKSVLDQRERITLQAPATTAWTEVWKLDVSPVWHVALGGIPVIHQQDEAGDRLPQWRPWPGEQVTIDVARPVGVPGQTLTIDQSKVEVTPGVRATDVTLTMNLRTSRGGQHVITLPDGSVLQSVELNGSSQPIRQEGGTVTVPLAPGSQSVRLAWRQGNGIQTLFRTPVVKLGAPSVNAEVQLNVPTSRWVLFVGGPRMGPAVLFWAMLLVLLVASALVARLRLAPLKAWQWVLLAIGLSQVPLLAAAVVVAWFLAMGARQRSPDWSPRAWVFNLRQLALAGWALASAIILFFAIEEGLLGSPDMQISGNGSFRYQPELRWFADRTTDALPTAWLFSVPMLAYRATMLAWAVWLALSLVSWLRWAWTAFTSGGLWRRTAKVIPVATVVEPPPGTNPPA